jgi:hypothetical protein
MRILGLPDDSMKKYFYFCNAMPVAVTGIALIVFSCLISFIAVIYEIL